MQFYFFVFLFNNVEVKRLVAIAKCGGIDAKGLTLAAVRIKSLEALEYTTLKSLLYLSYFILLSQVIPHLYNHKTIAFFFLSNPMPYRNFVVKKKKRERRKFHILFCSTLYHIVCLILDLMFFNFQMSYFFK